METIPNKEGGAVVEEFFLVADWGSHNYLFVPNVMMSASSIATPDGSKWNLSRTRLPDSVERVIVDSGGFAFFSRWGEYPFSLESYLDLVYYVQDTHPLFRVATLDYPCEPEIDRSQLMTNEERITKTVSNAVLCVDTDKSLPWLPVIQGYTIQEYLSCIEQYREAGLESDYWAIGSICSRKGSPYEIRNIVTKIKELHPKNKLHAFGLSLPYLADLQVFQSLYSSDSAAWNWGISGVNMRARKKTAALDYVDRVSKMIADFEGQSTLYDHCVSMPAQTPEVCKKEVN